jgi:hypothetical protein
MWPDKEKAPVQGENEGQTDQSKNHTADNNSHVAEVSIRAKFVSGEGQYHTNEPGKANRRPYSVVTLAEIRALVDSPPSVPKAKGRWFIPSTHLSRGKDPQLTHGQYWMLWSDLDTDPKPLDVVDAAVLEILAYCDYEIYASRSATIERPKCRVLVPLAAPLSPAEWLACQKQLNDDLEAAGLVPDRSSERVQQLCYLPNRGEYYDSRSLREGNLYSAIDSLKLSVSDFELSAKQPLKTRSADDANDSLVDFLYDQGLVTHADKSGRLDVECPWSDQHTSDTGHSSTSYFPAGVGGRDTGGFVCLHAHCTHRTTEEFKQEIGYSLEGFEVLPDLTPEEEAEQAAIRARNQLKAERIANAAIERAKFKDPSAMEKARREYQKEENERIGQGDDTIPAAEVVSLEAALNRFVFLADGSRVADVFNPHYDLAVDDWRRTYAASKEVFPQDGGKPDKEIPVSRLWIESPRRKSVICRTFKAGGGLVINDPQGRRALNSWKPYDRTIEVGDLAAAGVGLFLEHVDYLFGDDAGRFLDWLAHIEQHPGVLPHTAWLHISKSFGTGRNWLASVLTRVWAGNVAASFDLVKTLSSGFNDRLSRKVLAIVDEIREGGRDSQWDHSEKMKSLITEEHRTVNPKFGRISVEYNACRFLMYSNHISAIPMEEGDRRIEVVVNEAAPRPADYYTRLYQAISDQRFIAGVAAFLARRDLSNFNPGAHAVVTAAKRRATEASKTPMTKQCELLLKFWPCDVITPADLMSVLDYVPRELAIRAKMTANHRRTLEQFSIRKKAESLKVDGNSVKLYFIRNADYWENASNPALVAEYLKGLKTDRSVDGCAFLDDLSAV